jgi:hypothetical protein
MARASRTQSMRSSCESLHHPSFMLCTWYGQLSSVSLCASPALPTTGSRRTVKRRSVTRSASSAGESASEEARRSSSSSSTTEEPSSRSVYLCQSCSMVRSTDYVDMIFTSSSTTTHRLLLRTGPPSICRRLTRSRTSRCRSSTTTDPSSEPSTQSSSSWTERLDCSTRTTSKVRLAASEARSEDAY